jgi:hypothetical protein
MASAVPNLTLTDEADLRRTAWSQAMSMRQSVQQFRARLLRTASAVSPHAETDRQLGEAAATMTVLARSVSWALHDLDRLRLPEEFLEAVEVSKPRVGPERPPATGP